MNWNGYTFLLADSSTRIDDYSRLRGNPCKRRAFSRYHVISRIFLMAPPSRSISPPYQPSMHTMLFFFLFTRIPVFTNPLGFAVSISPAGARLVIDDVDVITKPILSKRMHRVANAGFIAFTFYDFAWSAVEFTKFALVVGRILHIR